MDERHWWIAGKIQESFKIGGYDNPTLLEDFMCEESTLNKVNKFFRAGGPCRLFFYCQKPESGVISTRELHVTGNLATLKDVDLDKVCVTYVTPHPHPTELKQIPPPRQPFSISVYNKEKLLNTPTSLHFIKWDGGRDGNSPVFQAQNT